jgi:PAS domain S-box-containing protein
LKKTAILIVEDEAIVSADIAGKLRKLGYDIAGTAATGEEAIALAGRLQPSLVLMDIRLAGAMDGITAADAIRRNSPVPVVFLTAHSDKPTLRRARQTEAFGYILKPFDDRELHTQIEMALYRHAAELRLRESQVRLATFASATFEGIIEIESGRIVDCNAQFARMLGYTEAELKGMEIARLIAPEDIARVTANIHQERESAIEHALLRKEGERIVVEARGRPLSPGRRITAIRDITEQKNREITLRNLNRTLTALSHSSAARMRATEEAGYLREVCKLIVQDCGHAMVWIGYAGSDDDQSVRPAANAGFEAGYLETLNITYADTERGRGPTGTAIRTGKTITCRNMLTDPLFTPWREDAIKRGYASSIALPLMSESRCFGAITIYSTIPDPFSEDEVKLLAELADDLAFGITSLRLRAERDRSEAALQKAHDQLERRVQERTADLRAANESLIREMEERSRVEAALRTSQEQLFAGNATLTKVIDGITDPLIMLDAQFRIKKMNRAARDYYGLTGYQEAIGKHCFEAFRGRSRPCETCERPFSRLHGYSGSFERKGEMDPEKIEQIFVYPVKDEFGAPDASIIRIHDITQAKMLERQLIQSEKLASLGLLISGIAHEINNPNTFVSFNLPILRDYLRELTGISDAHAANHPDLELCGIPYPEFRQDIFKLVDNMEHGSSRINATVSALKEFSRTHETVEKHLVALKPVIEKALAICGAELRKRAKSLKVIIPEDLPPAYIDPNAIEQVLINLLINAAHALDKTDSWIHVRVIPNRRRGQLESHIIEVADNGSGMNEKVRNNIFDPFFTTKAASAGTGLGLYVCRNLIEKLGGSITVDSRPGEGTVFRMILPTLQDFHNTGGLDEF